MITWMQRHKKWLIVTIWISTIAFVGAGFVGWGSYDYGKSNNTVAIVGGKEVPMNDVQSEYNALYSQYQQMFGQNFNQELAKQLKLEDAALQKVIQKYMILNYAQELGLMTTDEEVARELVKIDAFFKDGKFDKETYVSVLKQNRKSVAEFETQLKKDLLVAKVQKLFNIPLSQNEIKNIGSLLYAQDRVSIKILDTKDVKVTASEDEIKKHWDVTKESYKSPAGYKINYTKVENENNATKKQMKKVALKLYVKLKKDSSLFKETKTIYDNSNFLDPENLEKLVKAKDGDLLKPIYKDNNYYVIKLLNKVQPQTLPYEEVKEQVKDSFITQKKTTILEEKAKKAMENFDGKDIGYLTKNLKPFIDGLSDEESSKLVENVFASDKKINSMPLENKIVVYKITETKLAPYDKENDETVKSVIANIKANSAFTALLEQLKNRYETKSFMKE
jgi:peptidyl-prolyl cis-trans isomerase D